MKIKISGVVLLAALFIPLSSCDESTTEQAVTSQNLEKSGYGSQAPIHLPSCRVQLLKSQILKMVSRC